MRVPNETPQRRGIRRVLLWIGLGILTGIGVGLLVGWVLWPLEYTEADPSILEERFQRDYTLMIAEAYSMDQDMTLARSRLRTLGKPNLESWVLSVAVDHIVDEGNENESQFLVNLADAMGMYSPVMDPFLDGTGDESQP